MECPSDLHHCLNTSHLDWYPAREDGCRAKDTCRATRLENPPARVNRLIVTKHEDTAWTLPDETGGSGADAEGLWTVEERPGRRPPDPEDPETTASEANMEPRWSVELQRTTGASSNPPE